MLELCWRGARLEISGRLDRPRIDVVPDKFRVLQSGAPAPVQHVDLLSPPWDSHRAGGRVTAFIIRLNGADLSRDEAALEIYYENELLALARLSEAESQAVGAVDVIDSFGVSGWVFDRQGAAREAAFLRVDEDLVLPVRTGRPRRDVMAAGAADDPDTGFSCLFSRLEDDRRADLLALFDGREHVVELCVGDRIVASRSGRLGSSLRLEAELDGARVRGWIGAREWPRRPVMVEFLIDGQRVETSHATDVDADLMAEHGLPWACTFSFTPICAVSARGASRLEVRAAGALGEPTAHFSLELPDRVPRAAALAAARIAWSEGREGPVVVVPIHNAADALQECLESIAAHTPALGRLILVDDASTDPAIARILTKYERSLGAEIVRNAENLGYTRSVNRGVEAAGTADVILLNSDVRVTPRWLENLQLAARASPDIGTVTAVSDNAGAFSVPEPGPNRPPAGLTDDQYARLVTQSSAMIWPGAPTGNGFCMYIKRACLEAVGPFDAEAFPRGYGEENDFCMRAIALGWRHVVDERTLIYHQRSASFGDAKAELLEAGGAVLRRRHPDYRARVSYFETGQPMAVARARIAAAVKASLTAARPPRPRVLFVISTTGGGTPLTNADLMDAIQDRCEPFLLRSDSRAITLHRVQDGEAELLETFHLSERVDPASHRSADYDDVVGEWLAAYAIELLHIRHIAWHSLGLPKVARALSIPVVFSFHDFYAVCPTVKLLDENQVYCAGRCTPKSDRDCQPDLWLGLQTPPLKDKWVHAWRTNFARMLGHCDAFVTTSETAREVVLSHFPALSARPFRLIPHGRDMATMRPPSPDGPGPGEKLRVLVPGSISNAKGADLIRDIKALDRDDRIEFHILGRSSSALEAADVVRHGSYRREDFLRHVERIQPHIGAVLSRWPETYCHTLTELWGAGLPVVGLDIGAVGERLREEGPGWLAPLRAASEPEEVLSLLTGIAGDPRALARKSKAVAAWQRTYGRERTTAWMAAQYADLYRGTIEGRTP